MCTILYCEHTCAKTFCHCASLFGLVAPAKKKVKILLRSFELFVYMYYILFTDPD